MLWSHVDEEAVIGSVMIDDIGETAVTGNHQFDYKKFTFSRMWPSAGGDLAMLARIRA